MILSNGCSGGEENSSLLDKNNICMWLIFIKCDPCNNSDIQSFKGSQLISILTFKEHKISFSLIIFINNCVIQKCRNV